MWSFLTGIRPYLLLGLLCLALYAPGQATLPPVDRDEARFAQATRQMLETGDFVRIRFQAEPRNKKPAGIYWLQAASVAVFSDVESREIWPYRLPSALGAAAAVLLTFGLGQALVGRRAAFLGAALLASSLALVVEAHMAKTDAMLLAAVVAAQGALARIYLAAREGRGTGAGPPLLFWAALGFGMLIKGPIAPMIAVLTLVALKLSDRSTPLLRLLRPAWGAPLALAFVLPWLIAVSLVDDSGFIGQAVREDLLAKLFSGQEAHGFPPGYYLLLLVVTFWPGSLFVWHGLRWAWRGRAEPALRFCLAWIVPAWLLFELVPTKLPHYVLPLYPALALLAGRAALDAAEGLVPRLRSWDGRLAYLAWALAGLAIAGAAVAIPIAAGGGVEPLSLIPALAALTVAGAGLRQAWRGRIVPALAVGIVAAVAIHAPTLQYVLPRADGIWLSRSVAEAAARVAPARPLVAAAGYHEPSLVFLFGTELALTGPVEAARRLAAAPDGLVLVSGDNADAFRAARPTATPLATVRGFNYSKGRWLELTLYAGDGVGPGGNESGGG